jgi:hypothetical protein
MSERNKPHNGRDRSGHFKVKRGDVEEMRADQGGEAYVRDDVRLTGAVEDTGPGAGERGKRIEELVEQNRDDIEQIPETD